MGILNVTPDSFSDGGLWTDPGAAVRHAFDMVDQGAGVIDIGAESTRPNASPVTAEEELARLEPVLSELAPSVDVPISVDTMKAEVAERCVALGATIVNDVLGLRGPGMTEVCASTGVDVVIMHMNGMPESMPPAMGDGFMDEIKGFLEVRVSDALDAGIRRESIILDPGIGFGKDPAQNSEILENSSYFSCGGYPVLSASSRKRFLAVRYPGMDRDDASAEAALVAVRSGAAMVRVHDVARTAEILGIRRGFRGTSGRCRQPSR